MMQYPSIAWNLMRMLKPLACKKIQELPAISHENNGIKNNKQLIDRLKTKPMLDGFSKQTGISVEYLTLLNREAKSYLPNPCRLDKFSGIEQKYLNILEEHNIKNTRHFFNQTKNLKDRAELSKTTNIPLEIINEIFGLSDLSRAYGVGPVFARLIYDVGIHSIKIFIEVSAEEFIEIYEEKTQKKADFGVNDINFSLELARHLET